ncbi:NAD-dependent epimerase/dehydratase [Hyaloraphidium curvatum]|nr:NAD-dependent epimerase/dehydratase [Hyaloraphidium curvatum]
MKIAVFGATGGTGLAFLPRALSAGHTLRCLVRNPAKLPEDVRSSPNVEVVVGDVTKDEKAIEDTLSGCDALFITLGGAGTGSDVCSVGTKRILAAVKALKMDPKTVAVTSFGVGDSWNDINSYFVQFLIWVFIGRALADKEIQEADLKAAGLSHLVIVRPGGLTNEPPTGKWKAGRFSTPGGRISREDVAAFCLGCFHDGTEYKNQTPTLVSV